MSRKVRLIFLIMILVVVGSPVYAQAYGDASIIKIIFELIMYIIIFIIVIFMSLYGTKLVAKNFKGITNSKYIKILDAMNIPGGSKIVITKVNNKVYILSTSNNGTNILDIIDEDNFPIIEEDFDTYLSKYMDKNNLENNKIIGKIRLFFGKISRKKDKEDKKNEK